MILKNKLTKEMLEIQYSEFRKKFAKEIQRIFGRAMTSDSEQARKVPVGRYSAGTPNNSRQDAFESYRKTQLNEYSWNFKDDNSLVFNFYFELHWNFNHFGISNWFIEKM